MIKIESNLREDSNCDGFCKSFLSKIVKRNWNKDMLLKIDLILICENNMFGEMWGCFVNIVW